MGTDFEVLFRLKFENAEVKNEGYNKPTTIVL